MRKRNNLLITICLIYIISCNTNHINEKDQEQKKGKIENLTKEQVYEKFEIWLKDPINNNGETIIDTFKVILSDINKDGYLDGLVDFNDFVPKGGNATWHVGYPYFENTDNGLKYVTTLNGELANLQKAQKIKFKSNINGLVTVNAIRYMEGDASCCPSIEREETFVLRNDSFLLRVIPKPTWKYLDLIFIECYCFEGTECGFNFKESNGKIYKFDWYFSNFDSHEDIYQIDFQSKGYNNINDLSSKGLYYNNLKNKKVRVYYEANIKNPGECKVISDYGPECTIIKMLELIKE